MAATKKAKSEEARVDAVLAAVIGACDYDHAKQLDEATAEEPDEVEHNRRTLRLALVGALREQGLAIVRVSPRAKETSK